VKHETESLTSLSTRSIEDQLQKILASRAFVQSARMSRFLQFTVERALCGEADKLKEYVLGVEVFDRKSSYDPRVDPIVRVEARRLRSKLKSYYEGEGREDELIIEFPKGTYAPIFRARTPSQEAPAPATAPSRAIAVLPFSNLSSEPDTEYFSDGLTEELIHGLTKLEGLMVVAWSSAARLKDQPYYDVREIGRQLNVSTVLVGSVRSSGERLRVMAQLVDTSNGRYLWTEIYDRQIEDLFAIQEEISRAIVRTLRIKLMDRPGAPAIRHGAYNLEAYNLYLKGRFHWNKRTAEGLNRGVQHFKQAIAIDPAFAPGYAGLADSYSLLAEYGLASPSSIVPAAKEAARKALEIDPTLAEAHTSLALIRSLFDWEWAEAEEHYRRAIDLNPGYATAHHWFAVDYFGPLGRFDEAFEEIEIAQQLDPLSPIIREGKGFLLMLARRYDEAIEEYRETLELDSFFYRAFTSMGRAYTQKGMYEEAITMLQKGRSLSGDIPSILGALGQTYALASRPADARRLLTELSELTDRRHVASSCFALIHLGLGEKDRALDWLEAGARGREMSLASLKIHPAYDNLRGEPRFRVLLAKLGLAPAAFSEAS
jgi:TolB-like protein/Tfp pilus assembly protein PilF